MEKKKMKLWKKILICVLVLLAIFLILITRKFIIITKLANISKEYTNKTNYLEVVSTIQENNTYIRTFYNKDGNILSEMKVIGKSKRSTKYIHDYIYFIYKGK